MNWQHSDHEGNLPRIKRATCRASPDRQWVKSAQRTMNRTQPALNTPPPLAARRQGLAKNGLRVVPSQYVTNGLTVSLGLVLIMLAIFEAAGLGEPRQVSPPARAAGGPAGTQLPVAGPTHGRQVTAPAAPAGAGLRHGPGAAAGGDPCAGLKQAASIMLLSAVFGTIQY